MIRHVVLIRFKATTTSAQQADFAKQFQALVTQVPQVKSIEWGANASPEELDKGFTHCFLVSFDNVVARDAYLPHPAHQAFVRETDEWVADVLVIDYELSTAS
jgi:hypothetical protein